MGWALRYADEVWWSRVKQPTLHTWSEVGQPTRLQELEVSKDDPDPKALCCYGLLEPQQKEVQVRFVEGRPVSHVTTAFLEWLGSLVATAGRQHVVVIWDNASWHVSREVKTWIRQHNRTALQAVREGKPGVQIIPCWLPVKSPWLNRIEPHWVHGKKAVVEPARLLTVQEVIQRVCDYYGCQQLDRLTQKVS
jgi:DDE superfamily endonuclease